MGISRWSMEFNGLPIKENEINNFNFDLFTTNFLIEPHLDWNPRWSNLNRTSPKNSEWRIEPWGCIQADTEYLLF